MITGDRKWTDNSIIHAALMAVRHEAFLMGEDLDVIHGDAKGADRIAGQIAAHLGNAVVTNRVTVHAYPAKWTEYGRAAGPIRNREMLAHHPDIDVVLAFHADLLHSKGTRDMVELAMKHNLPVRVYPDQAQLDLLRERKKRPTLF